MAPLNESRGRSISTAVFEQLRDRIIEGELRPGEALPGERALSESLKVNRGAIREALKRLEQVGLVAIHHGGNTRILDYRHSTALDLLSQLLHTSDGGINIKIARNVLEMRDAIAPQIARLAARRAGAALEPQLKEKLEQIDEAAGNLDRVMDLVWEFWLLLAEGCDNVAYLLAANALHAVSEAARVQLLEIHAPLWQNADVLRRLADAVSKGDEDTAEDAAVFFHRRVSEPIRERLEQAESASAGAA